MSISLKHKEAIRQKHPLYGQVRIQVAHILDRFRGGSDEDENLEPLTVPEHIADHVAKAMESEDWGTARRQYGGAHLLAVNATPEEIKEANRLLTKLPKRR
jgi:hypothetical protein